MRRDAALARVPDDAAEDVLRPLASLLSKSEKAQRGLAADPWQHRMLDENIRALRLALELMAAPREVAREEREAALRALAAMIERTRTAMEKFAPGTSPHTLQRNRLRALRKAETRIKAA